MKKLSFILFTICLIFASCSSDDNDNQKKESQKLEKMRQEIVTTSLADSEPCQDPNNWDFTPLGTKACGGVDIYIVYSKKINKETFLTKVKAYTDAKTAFDTKWKIRSTCNITLPPSGVECVNGKPKLSYGPILY